MKLLMTFLALVLAQQASALALFTHCKLWDDKDDKAFYTADMMLVQHLGTPLDKLGVSPSVMSVVDLDKNVIFHGSLSHINEKSSEGLFEVIEKKFRPIVDGKVTEQILRVRQLSLDTQLLPTDKDGNKSRLTRLVLKGIHPVVPNDTTFVGEASMTVDGKTYKKMSANCSLFIDWSTYLSAVKKDK